jgi:phosphate transport system substrate-binding protein
MNRILFLSLIFTTVFKAVGDEIVIKGSDTIGAKLTPMLVERYKADRPENKFSIATEGTNSCFQSLFSNECDIGMASRPPTEDERSKLLAKNIHLNERVIGYSMTAIIIHKDQPVSNLTLENLEKIFTGEVTDWKVYRGKGKIVAYSKNSSSENYKTFQKMAMRGKPYGKNVLPLYEGHPYWAFEKHQDRLRAIAYVGFPYASGKEVKIVSVDGVYPSNQNTKKYPLTRSLRLYFREDLPKEAQDFVDWICTSEEAFAITEKVGFVSIRGDKKHIKKTELKND